MKPGRDLLNCRNGAGLVQIAAGRTGRLLTVMEAWEPNTVTFYAIHSVSTAHSQKIALFIGDLLAPGGIMADQTAP
ncbi:type 2 periplasmic-binding domain-containing protein [Gluconacetobacter aggeris]|uniref:hypothetical protein n=1 Tax=Gluconacetobacter aggeris TaxID=1286186 RepID=UPI001602508C|nr:hypothetical protein [Gluconacetobacter aggeris]